MLRLLVIALITTTFTLSAADAPKPLRALLITGGCCHDYARQKDLLKKGLEARANVIVDQIHTDDSSTEARFEIYQKPDWAAGYDIIIHDECSADVKEMAYVQNILNAHKTIPAVNLHCAMHSYRTGTDDWFKFVGIQSSSHGPQEPIEIRYVDKEHPISKTLGDWTTVNEELYNNVKIFETAKPIARGLQKVKRQDGTVREVETVVAWINDYGSTRVFSTTIGHNNATVADDRYLNLLTRGLLWACGKLDDSHLKAYTPPVRRVNIAKGKPALASSEESNRENFASKAFDDNEGTRWCANGASDSEWLQVDLQTPNKITGVRIAWEVDSVPYYYVVEGSADGQNWKTLVDAAKNKEPGPNEHNFQTEGIRYLRVRYLGKQGTGWGSIWEFTVYGDKTEVVDAKKETEKKYLGDTKIPDGFDATVFAAPPMANYPVFVAAAPDGTLYVSSDGNGSLGRDPHRGRILRLRDTDGDGQADEVKEFVKDIDSPRGLVWDRDRLYLLHPPHVSVFIDKDQDGVPEEQKILVKNIAFTFKDRPADHTSNGLTLGMDGWLYMAIGDFGFMEAEGTDGRKLQLRAGGVARVRPDGTGLELYTRGTRNILEVAMNPLLDSFARDNTNDGGGWDIRLHQFTQMAEHGYPSLYINFTDEAVTPLADYGGGSGCGAAWIDEPGIPVEWNNGAFTADWGRNWVYRHSFTPKGASFVADQKEFFGATRVTDLDPDAMSAIYLASWKGATFNWAGPDVGYIIRLTPKGYKPEPLPDFAKLSPDKLVALLESPSFRRRLEAQRELIARAFNRETVKLLRVLASDASKPLVSRVAAIFAIKQGLGGAANDVLTELSKDTTVREYALRALTDRKDQVSDVSARPIVAALNDINPRVRLQAAVSLARAEQKQHASALTPLLGDADARVAHTAVKALIALEADKACFDVVDLKSASAATRTGALRVLQALHNTDVVNGLLRRLNREQDATRRQGLLTALCRLHFQEGVWKGDSWGTRPDTSGPYYQPEVWAESQRIATALKETLAKASSEEAKFLVNELNRHKIPTGETIETVLALAKKDKSLEAAAIAQLARSERVPSDALPLLLQTTGSTDASDLARAQSVLALTKSDSPEAVEAILSALTKLTDAKSAERESRQARDAFFGSQKTENHRALLATEAARLNATTSPWADAALLTIANRKNASPEAKEFTNDALNMGWNDARRRAQILRAVTLIEHRPYSDKVLAALKDTDTTVVAEAKTAAEKLRLKIEDAQTKPANDPLIGDMQAAAVLAAVLKQKGDLKLGEELFTRQGCVACHTVNQSEALRGPFLGNIATIYKRPELAEAILLPNKTLAQGFVTQSIELKDDSVMEGFVTQEAADKVTLRNVAGQEFQVAINDIVKREKLDRSMMPEGLAATLSVREFASLLDYLESLAKQ